MRITEAQTFPHFPNVLPLDSLRVGVGASRCREIADLPKPIETPKSPGEKV